MMNLESQSEDYEANQFAGGGDRSQSSDVSQDQTSFFQSSDTAKWRQEVAARVRKYQARKRQKEPRFPSLFLKFESSELSQDVSTPGNEPPITVSVTREALAIQNSQPESRASVAEAPQAISTSASLPDAPTKIIEFPRSAAVPSRAYEELAEPMFDHPRIIEAPEIVFPPPALGGITIEPVEEPEATRRPGIEIPLQSASLPRRFAGVAVDALVTLTAVALFGSLFLRITRTVPSWQQAVPISVAVMGIFWIGYQYLLLVYSGTTPGLWIARLRIERFDGSSVPRRLRRWRVLASALSAVSLGLGYAWCIVDEDALCWHDRITRTYVAPLGKKIPKEIGPEDSITT
jgi:uncharacterized RDD family membrane protein YckC